jgi:peroxiredoxin
MTAPLPPASRQSPSARLTLGVPAPDFTLTASTGERVRLSSLRDQKNALVYFMRAFSCPPCRAFLHRLVNATPRITALQTQVMVVGLGTRAEAEKLSREFDREKQLTVMHDGLGSVYDSYMLDKTLFSLIQKSALFAIDKSGVIRFAHIATAPQAWMITNWIDRVIADIRAL